MSRSRLRLGSIGSKLPLVPLSGGKRILKEVISVPQMQICVDVACVSAENKHGVLVDDGRVMVARRRGRACRKGPTPGLLLNVEPQQVVQHALAIVAAKYVHCITVGDDGVLGSGSSHKDVALWHFSPQMNCFEWSKVKSQRVCRQRV